MLFIKNKSITKYYFIFYEYSLNMKWKKKLFKLVLNLNVDFDHVIIV